jgi:hypothetical protein
MREILLKDRKMRIAIMVAAFGVMMGASAMAPSALMPHASAQAVSATTEERALEARLVALAQAGDLEGVRSLVAAQVQAGNSGMVARIARRIAALGEQLASVDAVNSGALAAAAVAIVGNPSVASADADVAADVGEAAGRVAAEVATTNPDAAAAVQQAVATSGNTALQTAYISSQSGGGGNDTGDTPVVTPTPPVRVVTVRRPVIPPEPEVPVPVEPNPAQGGSPT